MNLDNEGSCYQSHPYIIEGGDSHSLGSWEW